MKDYVELKSWLGRLRFQEARIEAETERIARLRALSEKVTASCGSGAGGGGAPDRRYDLVVQAIDAEKELSARMSEMKQTEHEIRAVIAAVPEERLRTLLELRYIAQRPWDKVAEAMGYQTRQVHRLHGIALAKVEALALVDLGKKVT